MTDGSLSHGAPSGAPTSRPITVGEVFQLQADRQRRSALLDRVCSAEEGYVCSRELVVLAGGDAGLAWQDVIDVSQDEPAAGWLNQFGDRLERAIFTFLAEIGQGSPFKMPDCGEDPLFIRNYFNLLVEEGRLRKVPAVDADGRSSYEAVIPPEGWTIPDGTCPHCLGGVNEESPIVVSSYCPRWHLPRAGVGMPWRRRSS